MAAVGCMENSGDNNSGEGQDRCASDLLGICKKNGVNHKFKYGEKSGECIANENVIFEKLSRINGSAKPNSFTKPSIPTLRSRSERLSSGSESPRRTRRSSKQDKSQSHITNCKEDESESTPIRFPCTVDLFTDKNGVSSLSEEKEITRLAEGNCCSSEQVTPDTSRSCTPLSIGGSCVLSPISKDSRSADTQCSSCSSKDATYVLCKWKDCDCGLEPSSVMDHIKQCHVESQSGETFVCLWEGCKVYDKRSCSRPWLERHILTHSGDKPFKCIVDGCSQRFTSQKGLERHVNSHFASQQSGNNRPQKSREDTPTKLWRRKKLKRRRHIGVRTTDFFDSGIMEHLQQELTSFTQQTDIDLNGSSNSVTFHSCVWRPCPAQVFQLYLLDLFFFLSGSQTVLQMKLSHVLTSVLFQVWRPCPAQVFQLYLLDLFFFLSGSQTVLQMKLSHVLTSVLFQVIARRREESGKVKVLLHWTPENVIPDAWVSETEVPDLSTCSIPVNNLPQDSATCLHPSLYRQHRYRKHRRK